MEKPLINVYKNKNDVIAASGCTAVLNDGDYLYQSIETDCDECSLGVMDGNSFAYNDGTWSVCDSNALWAYTRGYERKSGHWYHVQIDNYDYATFVECTDPESHHLPN